MLAYLDANSGSVIISAVVAGAAGIAVVVKTGWRRMLGVVVPSKRAERKAAADAGPAEASTTEAATAGERTDVEPTLAAATADDVVAEPRG